jgi:hypothetical protein
MTALYIWAGKVVRLTAESSSNENKRNEMTCVFLNMSFYFTKLTNIHKGQLILIA